MGDSPTPKSTRIRRFPLEGGRYYEPDPPVVQESQEETEDRAEAAHAQQ